MAKLFIIAAIALGASGCTYVTGAQHAASTSTGDGWFTKDTRFLGMRVNTDVIYCPKEAPSKCKVAEMR